MFDHLLANELAFVKTVAATMILAISHRGPSLLLALVLASQAVAFVLFDNKPYIGSQEQHDEILKIGAERIAARETHSPPIPDYTRSTNVINKHENTPISEIEAARAKVAAAQVESASANRARMRLPFRNTYQSRHSKSSNSRRDTVDLPVISAELAAAAALVAEVDAAAAARNGTLVADYSEFDALRARRDGQSKQQKKRQATRFWMEELERHGTQLGDSTYKA